MSSMNFTFRQLKLFDAVARHLSFTRASEEMHLTQPAISMQIKQLEDHVGMPLFEQLGKKIFLTEAGKEMLRYSRMILSQAEEMRSVLDEMKGIQQGQLNIAVASTANYFAPKIIATFCKRMPNVKVNLDVANREGLLKHLADNDVDMVIMGNPPDGLGLIGETFTDNPLVVIAAPDHPLAGQSRIPMRKLHEETFLIREPGSGTRIAMERFFEQHGIELTTPVAVNRNESLKQAVQAGLGLGIVSIHTLEMELALKKIAVLDVVGFPIMRQWKIVYREGKRLSSVAQAFKDYVLNEAQDLFTMALPTGGRKRAKGSRP